MFLRSKGSHLLSLIARDASVACSRPVNGKESYSLADLKRCECCRGQGMMDVCVCANIRASHGVIVGFPKDPRIRYP